jgi:hypothetical protein
MMEYRRYTEAISSLNVVPADGGGSRVDRVRLTGGLTGKGRAVLAYYDGEARGDFDSQTALPQSASPPTLRPSRKAHESTTRDIC